MKRFILIGLGIAVAVSIFSSSLLRVVFAEEITKTIKVIYFFPRDGKQNPDGSKGIPNWFYYWGQITGKTDLAYKPSPTSPLGSVFGFYDFDGREGNLDKCVIFDSVVQKDNPTGPKGKAGIDCFGQTVLHERKHRQQFHNSGYPDTNGDGIPEWTHTMDQDLDWLSDYYEQIHGFNWRPIDSNGNGVIDSGELAISQDTDGDGILDLEEEPIQAEFGWPNNSRKSQDWAHPGQNWP